MFLSEFKISRNFSNYQSFLSRIILDNYSKEILKDTEHNLKEMHKLRQNVENINENLIKGGNSIEDQNTVLLKSQKDLIWYCNYVNKLIKKLELLQSYERKNALSLFNGVFKYLDIITGIEFSEDLHYEYLFALYNLSIVYFNLGCNLKYKMFEAKFLTEDLTKEAIKDFQQCTACLIMLKEKIREFNKARSVDSGINDFNLTVLNFKISLSQAETQSMIYHLSVNKNYDIKLQLSLVKSTVDAFKKLSNYLNQDPINKIDVSDSMKITNYYSNLYEALYYQKYADHIFDEFTRTGLDYGYGLSLLKGALVCLNKNLEYGNIPYLKIKLRYLLYNDFKVYEISTELSNRLDKNTKIYNQPIIELKYVWLKYTTESKYMVKDLDVQDDLANLDPYLFNELEPTQQTKIAIRFTNDLIKACESRCEKYISENDLQEFKDNVINMNIGEFNFLLNAAFDNESKIEANSNLYSQIRQVQKQGGENYIISSLDKIRLSSTSILNSIKSLRNKMNTEEQEDITNREKFLDDPKSKHIKCDYSDIPPSNSINKVLLNNLSMFESFITKAKEADKQVLNKLEKILMEPQIKIISDINNANINNSGESLTKSIGALNINQSNNSYNNNTCNNSISKNNTINPNSSGTSKTAKFIPTLKIITNSNLLQLNQYLSNLDCSKELKKEAYENFQKIKEWCDLLSSINILKQQIEDVRKLKEELKQKISNTSDYDLSKLAFSNNYEFTSKDLIDQILARPEFSDKIKSLDNLSHEVEITKKKITNNCDALRKIVYENPENYDSSNTGNTSMKEIGENNKRINSSLFNFKNQDLIDFKDNIDICCKKFFEVSKLIMFSEGFYNQHLTKFRVLEIQIIKFLIDRYIQKDAFINKYNNQGDYSKTLGTSKRVEELNNYLCLLEEEKIGVYGNSFSDPITNIKINENKKIKNK